MTGQKHISILSNNGELIGLFKIFLEEFYGYSMSFDKELFLQ